MTAEESIKQFFKAMGIVLVASLGVYFSMTFYDGIKDNFKMPVKITFEWKK